MKVSLGYKGVDELIKHLREAATLKDVQRVVKTNTSDMAKLAQQKAPVDTGFLRRSIVMKLEDDGLQGKVTPMAEYAAYLEYGTRFMAKQPFIGPAFNVQKAIFMKDMQRLFK